MSLKCRLGFHQFRVMSSNRWFDFVICGRCLKGVWMPRAGDAE